MNSYRIFKSQNVSEIVLFSIVFLFFFQLLSDFIEAIYAFGLLTTSLPFEMVSLLFLFSPVLLVLFKKPLSGKLLMFVGELMVLCRILEVMLDTRGRMIIAGLGVSCFMLLFPSLLSQYSDDESKFSGLTLGAGLTIGLSLSILFRAANSGIDISTHGWFQFIGLILAAIAGLLVIDSVKPESGSQSTNQSFSKTGTIPDNPRNTIKIFGISSGLMAVLLLLYFAFASPNVIARWTHANYLFIISVMMIVLCLFALILTGKQRFFAFLTPKLIFIWNSLFVLALVSTICIHQIEFPSESAAYPFSAPSLNLTYYIPLIIMLSLFPVILLDFIILIRELVAIKPSSRSLGGSFALASLFLMVMIFAQIFTSVYDYIPIVGTFFRDKFWLVFLIIGIVLNFSILLIHKTSFDFKSSLCNLKGTNNFPVIIVLISLCTIAGAFLSSPNSVPQLRGNSCLKILTYNIQQGYDKFGLKNYDGQLDLIQKIDADVIGLQETDTNRISGGNSDIVRYFADNLNLYSYYGPKTVLGTFGIALLSKYPIENPQTFFMYSEGEQTATIKAQINVGNRTLNIFVTHLGNGGPIVQQQAIMHEIESMKNVIAMGDFNFKPDTEQYQMTTEFLADSWLLRWPQGIDNQGLNPVDRIDHIFVSPEIKITDAQFIINTQSDHPAVTTQIAW